MPVSICIPCAMVAMLRIGVVSNEFFDRSLGRMGGFGFAAQQVIRLFTENPSFGIEVVCLPGEILGFPPDEVPRIHGAPAFPVGTGDNTILQRRRVLGKVEIDLLLTIDYRPSFLPTLLALPRTPLIVWVRDPRAQTDIDRVSSLELPDTPAEQPFGIGVQDCRSLRWVNRVGSVMGRPIHYATVSLHLGAKMEETFGVRPRELHLLPNIVPPPQVPIRKSERPSVLFLGRLDPIKRPWLFFELAERFPEVEFLVLGQLHGSGPSTWEPKRVPGNVRRLGHLEGQKKFEALASAWLLVNTSVHEAVAFSFFESLVYRTPIVSCQAGGGLVPRFGLQVTWKGGDGRDSLDEFETAMRELLTNDSMRDQLGRDGQKWVIQNHSRERFLAKFGELCRRSGLEWYPPRVPSAEQRTLPSEVSNAVVR